MSVLASLVGLVCGGVLMAWTLATPGEQMVPAVLAGCLIGNGIAWALIAIWRRA